MTKTEVAAPVARRQNKDDRVLDHRGLEPDARTLFGSMTPIIPSTLLDNIYLKSLREAIARSRRFSPQREWPMKRQWAGVAGDVKCGYGRTQEIADAALFLGFTGLVVPSARWECTNLVVFTEKTDPGQLSIVGSPKPVDWTAWREHRAAARGRTESRG